MALTTKQVAELTPREKRYIKPVGDGSGLGVRVEPSGTKSWCIEIQTGGRNVKKTLGRVARMTLPEAREAARLLRDKVDKNEPTDGKLLLRVSDLYDQWEQEHLRTLKTGNQRIWLYGKHIHPHIGHMMLTDVTRAEVGRLLSTLRTDGKAAMSNRVRSLIKQLFDYGVECGVLEPHQNPTIGTRHLQEKPRQVIFDDDQLRRLWATTDGDDNIGRGLRLQALTGCRIGEVLSMRWNEVENRVWVIPAEKSKSGYEHAVPLTTMARELMGDPLDAFVFPGRVPGQHTHPQSVPPYLRKRGLPTSHDLRRTVRTRLRRLRISFDTVERVIGHQVGDPSSRTPDTQDHLNQKLDALTRWERTLRRILKLKVANPSTTADETTPNPQLPLL